MNRELAALESQLSLNVVDDSLDQLFPFQVCQQDLIGVKFPGSPYIGID